MVAQKHINQMAQDAFALLSSVADRMRESGYSAHASIDAFRVGTRQAELELIGDRSSFELSITLQPVGAELEIWSSIHDADGSPVSKVVPTRRFADDRQAQEYARVLTSSGIDALSALVPKVATRRLAVSA